MVIVMRRRKISIALFASLLCSPLTVEAQFGNSDNIVRDAFIYKDSAYLMLLPEPLTGGGVRTMSVTPNGSAAVMLRFPRSFTKKNFEAFTGGKPPTLSELSQAEILLYSAADKTTRKLWTGNLAMSGQDWIVPFKNTDTFFARLQELKVGDSGQPSTTERFALINSAGVRWLEMPKLPNDEEAYYVVAASPTQAKVLIFSIQISMPVTASPDNRPAQIPERTVMFNVLGPQGWLGAWQPFKQHFVPYAVSFDSSGNLVRLQGANLAATENRSPWFDKMLNISTMQWSALKQAEFESNQSPEEKDPTVPTAGLMELQIPFIKSKLTTQTAIIAYPKPDSKTEFESRVVAFDSEPPTLASNLGSVYYISRGVAYVRDIAKLPKKVYEDAMIAAERAKLLSQVKQVGTSLLMYAADYDDILPSANGFNASLIDPYLRNQELTSGFVYTFAGGNITDLKDPANTLLGYVEGPGGRAEVYADGHAKWKPNSNNP